MTTEAPESNAIEFEGNIRKATDDLLTLAAKSGNGSAFVELSGRHSKRIQLRLYRILGNWEDTEDALQDSLLKAYDRLDQFRGDCNFSTWLMRIAINSALMMLRKRKVHPETSYDRAASPAAPLEQWDFPDASADPERLCADKETEDLLRSAISRLLWLYRSVFELFYTKDLSTIETAQVMGISEAAAKSRLLRARRTLRRSLPKLGYSTSHSVKSLSIVKIHRISKAPWTHSSWESAPRHFRNS
jgi:RNA polymerase sigma-70 factor (ECF subfamily)